MMVLRLPETAFTPRNSLHLQAEAKQAEAGCRGQLEEVEAELAELEAQLALGDMAAAAAAGAGGGAGAHGTGGGTELHGRSHMVAVSSRDLFPRHLWDACMQLAGALLVPVDEVVASTSPCPHAGGSGRKRRARRQQQEETEEDGAGAAEQHEQEGADQPTAARSKRRRRG